MRGACWEALRFAAARLAQPAERKALNLVVVGSSPTVGVFLFVFGPKHMGTAADMSLWILPRVSS